ncbi:neprilysin-21 [Drosophila tropicalis]|uniref:neprilysin-21 n=1 Tax=Drosophila tropicalis TaxID=46794 RepID=UPI0035ABD9BD
MGTVKTCFLLLVALLIGIESEAQSQKNSNNQLLNTILSYVNESNNACEDYYQYACGKYKHVHKLDPFSEITTQTDYQVNKKFVTLMDELSLRSMESLTHVEKQVWGFYQTCRMAPLSTRNSIHYLELVPPGKNLSWPQFAGQSQVWRKDDFKWMETLARLRRYGLSNVLIKVEVLPDQLDGRKYMIDIDKPRFAEKSERLKGPLRTRLMLMQLGVSMESAAGLARALKKFETAVRDLAEVEDEPNDDLTIIELERLTGGNWRRYMEILLGHPVSLNYKVQIQNVDYFVQLINLINFMDSELIASYLMLRFVMHTQEDSMDSDEAIDCIKDLRINMNFAMNLLYREHFFEPGQFEKYQDEVHLIFNQIRSQFINQVRQNRLRLKVPQRTMVTEKLNEMDINIGNLPKNLDHRTFVQNVYKDFDLPFPHLDYAARHLKLLEIRTHQWLLQLNFPDPMNQFMFYVADAESSLSSTPYYMLRQNLVIVPYGILQEPVFGLHSHDIFKVSLLGFMLSHEVMHGFVNGGIIYDANGSSSDVGVRILESSRFEASMDCMNRDETDYLDERMADITGIRLAYDTYFGPGSTYSREQPKFTEISLRKLFF